MMKIVNEHSHVDVDYEGRLEDGRLFDTSKEDVAKQEGVYHEGREYTPLCVELGHGMLIKGFEDALIGMKEGEEKTVKIESKDAYGNKKEELIQRFDRDPERDKELKVGMMVAVDIQGRQMPALVIEAGEKIALDFNHPLAEKNLTFKIKVVKIED